LHGFAVTADKAHMLPRINFQGLLRRSMGRGHPTNIPDYRGAHAHRIIRQENMNILQAEPPNRREFYLFIILPLFSPDSDNILSR
jgi:hypothetical protein